MEQNIFFAVVLILAGIAVLDLIVGVSNDAVNFLNSAIGSAVATRRTILIVASLGLLAGVLFSSGLMEVARKGIFNPQFFTMPELMMLFGAVMIADVLILDFFNSHGLPTSTTVSIVFELLGAAVVLSLIKIILTGGEFSDLAGYINSAKALTIIGGIFLSILVAFAAGALIQFVARLLFTFKIEKSLVLFGGLWGGLCMASIALFILLKGAKGATFITPEVSATIKTNLPELFFSVFVVSGLLFQVLLSVFRVNILKPIVLIGTFSLALAFAANDLVNFIGVPVASFHAYSAAYATESPLTVSMDMLSKKVPSSNGLLLLSGLIMMLGLWLSRKARSVTQTELRLSSQAKENERFEPFVLSRVLVSVFSTLSRVTLLFIPNSVLRFVDRRYSKQGVPTSMLPFDLVRASTNLMVASVLISFATSLKLPLSTTYVTFMVAMGTSFADRAWENNSAAHRVAGVLMVIGGWFVTALVAFSLAGLFVTIIYFGGIVAGALLLAFAGVTLFKTRRIHDRKFAQELATPLAGPQLQRQHHSTV